jgi:hypothetical protein
LLLGIDVLQFKRFGVRILLVEFIGRDRRRVAATHLRHGHAATVVATTLRKTKLAIDAP